MKIFIIVFAITMAFTCFWISYRMVLLYFRIKKWQRVDARIISKEVVKLKNHSNTRNQFTVKAQYSFTCNNQKYIGTKVYLVELLYANFMKQSADEKLNETKPTMSIYVNPGNANESVMFCDGIGLYTIVFFMGCFALLYLLSSFF
jgi:Protein of unknown function (DUF3592)